MKMPQTNDEYRHELLCGGDNVPSRDWDEADFSRMSGAGHAFAPAVPTKAMYDKVTGKVYFVEYEDFTTADRGL